MRRHQRGQDRSSYDVAEASGTVEVRRRHAARSPQPGIVKRSIGSGPAVFVSKFVARMDSNKKRNEKPECDEILSQFGFVGPKAARPPTRLAGESLRSVEILRLAK
jgi:hypothetical protein